MITQNELTKKMNYNTYRQILDELMTQGKTTGDNQSEDYLNYAKMNLQRMNRLEKTTVITNELKEAILALPFAIELIVLTEGWCGDAAQNIPVFAAMENLFPDKIKLTLLLRDENLDIMDRYLTNGGRAIPKVIAQNALTHEEFSVWGPRPEACQNIMLELKEKGADLKEKAEAIHGWYAKDKTQSLQNEWVMLIKNISK
jgi:hypothetical protein